MCILSALTYFLCTQSTPPPIHIITFTVSEHVDQDARIAPFLPQIDTLFIESAKELFNTNDTALVRDTIDKAHTYIFTPKKHISILFERCKVKGFLLYDEVTHKTTIKPCFSINYFAIKKSDQRKGFGQKLLHYLANRKPYDLRLSVYKENFAAREFYQKQGFSIDSENQFEPASPLLHLIKKRVSC